MHLRRAAMVSVVVFTLLGCGGPPSTPDAGNPVSAVVAGNFHGAALKRDGTVWTWGWNRDGQLGDGTTADSYTAAQAGVLSQVTALSAGGNHTVALKSDGTVWAWGSNQYGQLGDGSTTSRATPTQVPGLTAVTSVVAGYTFTLARKADGTVWVWGDNFSGIIGDWASYPTGKSPSPTPKAGLAGVTALTAGWGHALALESDGSVWTWGDNGAGQLGGGTVNTSSMRFDPQQVATGVAALASGCGSDHNRHSIVLKADHTAWTFGYNSHGELGDGSTTARSTPVLVPGLAGVTAVAAGATFSLALRSDGTVSSWGFNQSGQLGDGTLVERHAPAAVSGLAGVTALAAGTDHAVALKSDGTVWSWGGNATGALGDGTTTTRPTPVQVTGL